MTNDPRFVFLHRLARQGGPAPGEDAQLLDTITELHAECQAGTVPRDALTALHSVLPFTPDTLQGFTLLKPNGYAGCYETIERIYRRAHSSDPSHYNWDRFCLASPPARAVRNRKDYFIEVVHRAVGAAAGRRLQLLNVASGPGRDLRELFDSCPDLPVDVVCVEQDPRAIAHATALCADHLGHLEFVQANALTFATDRTFDLIWSAGLFDYLTDAYFAHLLRRLFARLRPGGELVVGNFCRTNPGRPYMEFIEWSLHHRTATELRAFAAEYADRAAIGVHAEPAHVNLFLHLRSHSTSTTT
jgi:extracellular factor (EF) 3-hydroxypalmitic acid methyl ester biosynthesis protein